MTVVSNPSDVERFQSEVASRLGMAFEERKLDDLAKVLQERVRTLLYGNAALYLDRLTEARGWDEEWRKLAEILTVCETYFFRYWDHFRAFSEAVLPDCQQRGRIQILSAGCASGEEPYSLAILLRESVASATTPFLIGAIDINHVMLQKAKAGRYSPWSLRETPDELRQRYFRTEGREFVIDDAVRQMVTFEERNLLADDPAFWQAGRFDLILCRNVTMYFTPSRIKLVVARIAEALRPGGYLFLGHAETLRGISDDFHLRHTHGTFYYQKRGQDRRRSIPTTALSKSRSPETAVTAELVEAAGSWVEAIRRASEHVTALTAAPSEPAEGSSRKTLRNEKSLPVAVASDRWDPGVVIELLRSERFSKAMDLLRDLPPECSLDPEALLLRAVILTNSGDLLQAERACKELLESNELSSGAHYLMALCRELAGDLPGALDHDQTAAYLDPGFAMPHLHLGLLAKRQGSVDIARQELGQALILLSSEDASRILLFGGGFSREALVELSRAELRACGGNY